MLEGLSKEEIDAWVSRHLASAPERDESWSEGVMAAYLGESKPAEGLAA